MIHKLFLISILLIACTNCQIHRAVNQNVYHLKYDVKVEEKQTNYSNVINTPCCDKLVEYQSKYTVWCSSILGALLVGLSGVLPLAILPRLANQHDKLIGSIQFKCLVSFAAGSLLGDVFIHLLPETFTVLVLKDKNQLICNSLWILIGLLTFFILEKLFPDHDVVDDKAADHGINKISNCLTFTQSIKNVGILNLIANVIDNFTHGIAVAGSFQASFKFGMMTLMATLLHEIPHEIGDFVILLKSGLNYKQAAVSQFLTAFGGILGAIFALIFSSAEEAGDYISWILPFTSGGFLYISLVSILPEIVNETNWRDSVKQIIFLEFGVLVIYLFS